jgi:hypothetical protein
MVETTFEGFRAEWAAIEKASALPSPQVHAAWVHDHTGTTGRGAAAGSAACQGHDSETSDGNLEIVPRPSIASERQAEISGRVKQAARVQLRNSDLMSVMGPAGCQLFDSLPGPDLRPMEAVRRIRLATCGVARGSPMLPSHGVRTQSGVPADRMSGP